ncbi:MAG TPA: PaaI family thioesterase [Aeromicrobium sp.]|nr:PaaI family thioesterase [Aeromicrobium sp.]
MTSHWMDEPVTDAETARVAEAAGGLAASVRDLIDAVIRSEVDPDELETVRGEVDALTKRLRVQQIPGSFGETHGFNSGSIRAWGNAAIGRRNAIAPPIVNEIHDDGTVVGCATLGAAYEGPPGMAHGGVVALLLDQVLGEAAHVAGRPGFTAYLTVTYRHLTKLGKIRAEARAEPPEPGAEHKTLVRGALFTIDDDGAETLCAEAEGLFILPRHVRDQLNRQTDQENL